MKKAVICILIVVSMLSMAIYAFADTYTLEEILPSIATLSDEDLVALIESITTEQAGRNIKEAEEVQEENPIEDTTPITEREDYVERESVKRGDKGEQAKAIQEKLIELGFLAGGADGDFGQKSEAAVKLFQKANHLEETGIADSISQYVMYSDMVVDKEAYDNMPIATGDGWELIKEYHYKWSKSYYYYICVIKNTSGFNAKISVNVVFYDADDNIVGVNSDSEYGCENGFETCWVLSNDMEYDHVVTEITVEPDNRYVDGGQSCIELSTSIVGKKVIITAKNNGKSAVEFLEYHVLFLNDKGEVVSTNWGYLDDDDNELKPGATEMRDESYSKGFSDVKVYALGRIDS